MDEREKIERLAKAMGHDVWRNDQGFTIIDGLPTAWNPWERPEDLRQVIEYIERKATREQVSSLFEKMSGMYDSKLEAACSAIRIPSMLADAALAVLEGVC